MSFIEGMPAVSPLVIMWSSLGEGICIRRLQYQDTTRRAGWVTCPAWTRGGGIMDVHHSPLEGSRWDWKHNVTHKYTNDPIFRCWWLRVDIIIIIKNNMVTMVSKILTPLSCSDPALTGRRSPPPGCPDQCGEWGLILWTTESSWLVSD